MSLYVGTVVGFRHWRVNPSTNRLQGPVTACEWPHDQRMAADCVDTGLSTEPLRNPVPHESPDVDCQCGLYAYHTVEDARDNYANNSRNILGAAVYWGAVHIRTAGFRAQYGRIVALSDCREDRRRDGERWEGLLDAICERYKIPLVPLDLLEEYAGTFGAPMGQEFDPE